jgi:hypothetical protein
MATEPTDDERMHAYQECRRASIDAGNLNGLNFIVDVFKLDIPAAVRDWFLEASKNGVPVTSCFGLLTEAQKKPIMEEIFGEWGTLHEGHPHGNPRDKF